MAKKQCQCFSASCLGFNSLCSQIFYRSLMLLRFTNIAALKSGRLRLDAIDWTHRVLASATIEEKSSRIDGASRLLLGRAGADPLTESSTWIFLPETPTSEPRSRSVLSCHLKTNELLEFSSVCESVLQRDLRSFRCSFNQAFLGLFLDLFLALRHIDIDDNYDNNGE